MLDIFNSDAFSLTSLAAAIKKIPYKPQRLGPGGLALFDERPIATTSISIESVNGLLSLIGASARGSAGDIVGDAKRTMIPFTAQHLVRNAKVMADEVQGVRVFGTEDMNQTVEAKVAEKLATIQAMHEVTWEYHRVGALIGSVLDADGSTVLLDVYSKFGVSQQTADFELTDDGLDVRQACEGVADLIDDELGGSTYDRLHVFCGADFYDDLIAHPFVQAILRAQLAQQGNDRALTDLRGGFTIGPLTFERAKRWKIKNANGDTITMIAADVAYAFPIGAASADGPMFIGRFAPQPFFDTVNRLNPPLVVNAVPDPHKQFIELKGISCPLYLNTRPRAVVKLTKS